MPVTDQPVTDHPPAARQAAPEPARQPERGAAPEAERPAAGPDAARAHHTRRAAAATVCLDFDGVLHTYDRGWADGTIYGELVPRTVEALRALTEHHAVVVHTTRDVLQTQRWLAERTPFTYLADTGDHPAFPFWNDSEVILVSHRKWAARCYVDDRAIHFGGDWGQVMMAIARMTRTHVLIPPSWPVTMDGLPQWPTYPDELARLARQRARQAARLEWRRRVDGQVVATPAEHADAMADAALTALGITDYARHPGRYTAPVAPAAAASVPAAAADATGVAAGHTVPVAGPAAAAAAAGSAPVPAPAAPTSPLQAAAVPAPGNAGGPGPDALPGA